MVRYSEIRAGEVSVDPLAPADAVLDGIAQYEPLEILYRPHLSRRDLVLQSPASGALSAE